MISAADGQFKMRVGVRFGQLPTPWRVPEHAVLVLNAGRHPPSLICWLKSASGVWAYSQTRHQGDLNATPTEPINVIIYLAASDSVVICFDMSAPVVILY